MDFFLPLDFLIKNLWLSNETLFLTPLFSILLPVLLWVVLKAVEQVISISQVIWAWKKDFNFCRQLQSTTKRILMNKFLFCCRQPHYLRMRCESTWDVHVFQTIFRGEFLLPAYFHVMGSTLICFTRTLSNLFVSNSDVFDTATCSCST